MVPSDVITPEDLPLEMITAPATRSFSILQDTGFNADSIKDAVSQFERNYIIEKLKENEGNISRTAEKIGIARRNLTHKIKAYNINVQQEVLGS
jgi:two-component system nitrogen regulation response regulator NtrX